MSNHIESFKDYLNSVKITEAEKEAEDNLKIKDLMEKAKEFKEKAGESKKKYEDIADDPKKKDEAELELLKYKKFRAAAELAAADAKLLRKGIEIEENAAMKERKDKNNSK